MGAGLLAIALYQSTFLLADTPHSRASPLPHRFAPTFFCAHFSNFLAETILPFLSLLSFVTIDYIHNDKPLHEATAQARDHMMRCHHV